MCQRINPVNREPHGGLVLSPIPSWHWKMRPSRPSRYCRCAAVHLPTGEFCVARHPAQMTLSAVTVRPSLLRIQLFVLKFAGAIRLDTKLPDHLFGNCRITTWRVHHHRAAITVSRSWVELLHPVCLIISAAPWKNVTLVETITAFRSPGLQRITFHDAVFRWSRFRYDEARKTRTWKPARA